MSLKASGGFYTRGKSHVTLACAVIISMSTIFLLSHMVRVEKQLSTTYYRHDI